MAQQINPFIEFTDATNKIRRNLLLSSSTLLFISLFNIKIDSLSVNGIGIKNLETEQIIHTLFFIVLYFFISFCWHAYDEHAVWRFKLTNEDRMTDIESLELVNTPPPLEEGDPRYSGISALSARFDINIKRQINYFKQAAEIENDTAIQRYMDKVEDLFLYDVKRIKRFEDSLQHYSYVKKIRYFIFEIGIPILLGILAMLCLSSSFVLYIQQL